MARHHGHHPHPSLSGQPLMPFDRFQGPPLFSPALSTTMQQGFHTSYVNQHPLQTPIQPFFAPQPPPAPGRPTHRGGQGSIAQLAAAGIHPPSGFPATPLGGHFPRHSMALGQPPMFSGGLPQPPYQVKHKKQLSVGGPPKAPLGGPGRKHSPLPIPVTNAAAAAAAVVTTAAKPKKVPVNIPKETLLGDDGSPVSRQPWARHPIPSSSFVEEEASAVEATTGETFPPDRWRIELPDVIDVYLPGRTAWDAIVQKTIETKLEKLGVEPGLGSNIPHIYAPHARAASISSPADPALLMFKLNKLQQAQASLTNSLSTSPQPSAALSPSPHLDASPFSSSRHGHSLTLAHPLTLSTQQQHWPPIISAPESSNPFGPNAVLGGDIPMPAAVSQTRSPGWYDGIAAPQGRAPVAISSLAPPPLSAVRPPSRPDFIRGFGLDIPEEEEPEEEEPVPKGLYHDRFDNETRGLGQDNACEMSSSIAGPNPEAGQAQGDIGTEEDGMDIKSNGASTAAQSRLHSRHVSRLSGALTLVSVGGVAEDGDFDHDPEEDSRPRRSRVALEEVEEWTGSEDIPLEPENESSDDESLDEYSNPSDEERARRNRLERRLRRLAQRDLETPRRLPQFPRPPDNTLSIPLLRAPDEDDQDIISNPSEEEHIRETARAPFEYLNMESDYSSPLQPDLNSLAPRGRSPRPLPPLPHSRGTSITQLSHYDPAQAHSRVASDQLALSSHQKSQQKTSIGERRDSLNPFAKPFVFGAPRTSDSWTPQTAGSMSTIPIPIAMTEHTRSPSFGKPLNAAAQEFKPTGFSFNFRPPAGVPYMTFPPPAPRSLSDIPAQVAGGQGREKRQRRESLDSPIEEGDSMSSFKFPLASTSIEGDNQAQSSPKRESMQRNQELSLLNPTAEPFILPAASFSMPPDKSGDIIPNNCSPGADQGSPDEEGTLPPRSATKAKRAPIPLDFKHSNTTVPAGLFKALVNNGEERTRRTVRSRLGSHEVLDVSRRASLESIDVPTISRKISRSLLTGDTNVNGNRPLTEADKEERFDPALPPHMLPQHRDSLPTPRSTGVESSSSGVSIPQMSLVGPIELQHLEQRLESVLDDRFDALRRQMTSMLGTVHTNGIADKADTGSGDKILGVIELIRTQLQESVTQHLEANQIGNRGELDLVVLQDTIQQQSLTSSMQKELGDLVARMHHIVAQFESSLTAADSVPALEVKRMIENFSALTVGAVVEAIQEQSVRLETVERGAPARDRDALVEQLLNALLPMMSGIRTERVDHELLTEQLAQAVKPHISQLIDLTSDKRETAGLIIEKLIPLLPKQPSLDTDAITAKLVTEIRRAIAPIDAFEIKEQVADLVVERLDARLAVRDKSLNADNICAKVTEGVSSVLEPLLNVSSAIAHIEEVQTAFGCEQAELSTSSKAIAERLAELSEMLSSVMDEVKAVQASQDIPPINTSVYEDTATDIKSALGNLANGQCQLSDTASELLSRQTEALDRISILAESVNESSNILQASMLDVKVAAEIQEIDELRKANTDLQVQLAKARGSHGQVRVEKDLIGEKLLEVESDREALRSQMKDAQNAHNAKIAEAASFASRNKELEVALAQALARLQASDVTSQAYQAQIVQLETDNNELASEKQLLKTKVDSLEIQAAFATRDKETAVHALATLQKQYEMLSSREEHWEALQTAVTQMATISSLMENRGDEELDELKRIAERSKILEGEHNVLQKRLRDQEMKTTHAEKTSAQLKQSLAQTQQRSLEWEKRAKEYEGQLEFTKTKLEHAEQMHAQLDADYSLVKMQVDERDADDRLVKDRENKLNDQIVQLEARISSLQKDLEFASSQRGPVLAPPRMINGSRDPHRLNSPDSRVGKAYGVISRSTTPTRHVSSLTKSSSVRSDTSEDPGLEKSVRDSMHAPRPRDYVLSGYSPVYHSPVPGRHILSHIPLHGRLSQTQVRSIPSPTPSTVSQAPTLGADGWYE